MAAPEHCVTPVLEDHMSVTRLATMTGEIMIWEREDFLALSFAEFDEKVACVH